MAEAAAGDTQGAAAPVAAVASVVVAVDTEAVGECLPFGTVYMTWEEVGPGRLVVVALYFVLQAPLATFEPP